MNKTAVIASVALAAALFGTAAIAAPEKTASTEAEFRQADGNKDNMVTFEEARGLYPSLARAIFNMADGDKDGMLDEGEYTQLNGLVNRDDNSSSGGSSSEPPPPPPPPPLL